jgi:hypothetical protein
MEPSATAVWVLASYKTVTTDSATFVLENLVSMDFPYFREE